jgi:serine/threonine protein kinase
MTIADASAAADVPGALPVGTRLGEYELRSVIGVGGFGIVYLAFDHALEREVAIKEYMPGAIAGRGSGVQVTPLSQSVAENFELGLRSFVNEGRMLARFDSPSLLKVYRYWEANGTAYITMPLYRGHTLKEHRESLRTPPDEALARALLLPLLGTLELLHRESIFHRDIAPDNILVEAGNLPVLLDFGAARRVIGEKSQTLTAVLKPAYAPIEQYGEAQSLKQGPWTDLYALGATMHYLLLGQAPPPSTARALQDDMQPLAERGVPGCSAEFLKAIDWMLAPRPADRPQSVAALVDVLEGRAVPPPLPLRRAAPATAAGSAEEVPTQPPPRRCSNQQQHRRGHRQLARADGGRRSGRRRRGRRRLDRQVHRQRRV